MRRSESRTATSKHIAASAGVEREVKRRPKKRARKNYTSKPEISDEEDAFEGMGGNSPEDAIDVDLFASKWEPASDHHYVSTQASYLVDSS